MGRDIFTGAKKKQASEDVTTVNMPLQWFTPKTAGSGISFGPGISYQTGEEPSGIGTLFPSYQRICLVETMLPLVEFTIVHDYGTAETFLGLQGAKLQSLSITDVERTAVIQVIPDPYHSTGGVIRQNGDCEPEILITVLGYRDVVRGLAIAEKVSAQINRYPYYLDGPYSEYDHSPQADEYYFTEKELADAIEAAS